MFGFESLGVSLTCHVSQKEGFAGCDDRSGIASFHECELVRRHGSSLLGTCHFIEYTEKLRPNLSTQKPFFLDRMLPAGCTVLACGLNRLRLGLVKDLEYFITSWG